MNRLVRGSILLAAAALQWSCGSDATADNAGNIVKVIATPSVIFITNAATDSQAVIVEAVNEFGQQNSASFTATGVSAGLTVTQDPTYGALSGGGTIDFRARFFVKAASTTSFVSGSFTLNAGGQSVTIPVKIVPANLDIAIPNPTPALGEAVTLTAPAGITFSSNSAVTVPGGIAVVTGVSADSTQITFLLGPGITDQSVTVTRVVASYLPGQTFSLATTSTLTTPAINAIPGNFSTAAPQVGDTVALTLTAPYKALPTASVVFGGVAAIVTSISADSSTIRFLPPPGGTGNPLMSGFVLSFLTAVPLNNIPAASALTVAGTTRYTGTDNPATAPIIDMSAFPVNTDTLEFYDIGSQIDQFYQILVTGASVTVAARLSWPGTGSAPDIDILWCNAGCTAFVGNFSGATGALPENSTVTFTTGAYNFWVNVYAGAIPAWYRIRFIRTA